MTCPIASQALKVKDDRLLPPALKAVQTCHGVRVFTTMQVLVPSVPQSHSLHSFRPPQCVAFGQLHSPAAAAALHYETPQLASTQWHCSARSRHCQKRQTTAAAYGRGRDEQKPKDVKSIRRIPIFPLQQVAMPSVIIPLNIFEARCEDTEHVRSKTHELLMHAPHAERHAFCPLLRYRVLFNTLLAGAEGCAQYYLISLCRTMLLSVLSPLYILQNCYPFQLAHPR